MKLRNILPLIEGGLLSKETNLDMEVEHGAA